MQNISICGSSETILDSIMSAKFIFEFKTQYYSCVAKVHLTLLCQENFAFVSKESPIQFK
jgi:hypothetical protein